MYNPFYSKTHQYFYVQTESAAGADEDTLTFYTTMRQTNKPIIVFLKNIFIILISYFLNHVISQKTTTSRINRIYFVLAPLNNVNGTSHATTCRQYNMKPTEKLQPIAWNEATLTKIAHDFNFVSYGKLGCCEQTAYCDWEKKKCFATGFGRSSGYYNGGWKQQVTEQLASQHNLGNVAPVYSCIVDNHVSSHAIFPEIHAANILRSTTVEVLGKDFGKDAANIEIFLGDRQCKSVETCHTVCMACSADNDCSIDEECFKFSVHSTNGMCLKPCQYNIEGGLLDCTCNTECRRLYTGVQYKSFCMNKGVTRVDQICNGATAIDTRLTGNTNSKVLCKAKHLYAVCTDAVNVNDLKSDVSLSTAGFLSKNNALAKISLAQCKSNSDCNDDDPCTVDTCSSKTNSNGNSIKCCKHIAANFCETAPIELGKQSQYPISKDYFVWISDNRTLVKYDNNFAKIAKIYIDYPTVAGFEMLSVSDVDDYPLSKVDLPFLFQFYDENYKQIWVNPNGAIQFDDTNQCSNTFMAYDCSFHTAYNNLIASLVTDLNPKEFDDSKIYYRKDPGNGFVDIMYKNIPLFQQSATPTSSPRYTFLTRLYSDGTIQIFYDDIDVPIPHKPSLFGLRDKQKGHTINDILLNSGTASGTIQKNSLVTFCPSPNFACTETKCGKPGSLFKVTMIEKLKCANEELFSSTSLQCRFGEFYVPATYSSVNDEISCTVPSHFASGYSDDNNKMSFQNLTFTVNVAIVVGDNKFELPLYSVHEETVNDCVTKPPGEACDIAKPAFERTPLTFVVDNRDSVTCNHIQQPTCGACMIENNANAGKDCMGKCFGYAVKDSCEICTGGTSGIDYDTSLDCANVCQGKAKLDVCRMCSGGTTKREAVTDKSKCVIHCQNGQVLDDCGICGGNNALKDCDGVCFGSNTKCLNSQTDRNGDGRDNAYREDDESNGDFLLVFAGAFIMSFGLIVYYTLKYRRHLNNQVQDLIGRDQGLLRAGVTNDELNTLYTWQYKGRNEEGVEDDDLKFGDMMCSICISEYCKGEILRRLHCNHSFHAECIDMWFQDNRCCPICKQDVAGANAANRTSESVEIELTEMTSSTATTTT